MVGFSNAIRQISQESSGRCRKPSKKSQTGSGPKKAKKRYPQIAIEKLEKKKLKKIKKKL